MTYTREPVTPERLALVFAYLWPRGREEAKRNGLHVEDVYRLFLTYTHRGPCGILCADGVPVMASGICADGDSAFTWFQATDKFDDHAREITKVLRRESQKYPGDVYIYSVMVHPQTERWFRALGFAKDDWEGKTAANWPLFRFRRRLCA